MEALTRSAPAHFNGNKATWSDITPGVGQGQFISASALQKAIARLG